MTDWLVGVDAGGTNTRAAACNPNTGQVREGRSAGANWTVHGPETCRERIEAAVSEALPAGVVPSALCLCIAGYYPPDHEEAVTRWAESLRCDGPVRVEPDVVGAWAGAFGGEPGIVLISGTGSICYGRNAQGGEARAGGWGPLIGDPGSAYAVGLGCLRLLAERVDGIRSETSIGGRVLRGWPELGTDLRGWLRGIYRCNWGREQIAGLAQVVFAAAREGDPDARLLAEGAAMDLILSAKAVSRKLGGGVLPLALQGGMAEALLSIVPFPRHLAELEVPVTLVASAYSPLSGALLLAAETWGGRDATRALREKLR